MERIARIATGPCHLKLVVPSDRIALALPSNRRAAIMVANLYQPQRWKGHVFRSLIKAAIATGASNYIPTNHHPSTMPPMVSWLEDAAREGMIGFLGCNPNHGTRCVLTGIDPSSNEPFIAKLGIDESRHAIARESISLELLSSHHRGVIHPLGLQSGDDWSLLRLPHLDNASPGSITSTECVALLSAWLGEEECPLGENSWASHLLAQLPASTKNSAWVERLQDQRVRKALIHGDMAVWNLRLTPEGLVAIDWEWAEPDGIAGIDLLHALRQEAYMVKNLSPRRTIQWIKQAAESDSCSPYLRESGWSNHIDDWIRLGLMHSHYQAKNDSTELLAELGIHATPAN